MKSISILAAALPVFLAVSVSSASAAATRNPISKLFVTSVEGKAELATETKVQDLQSKSVFSADGVVIETKKVGTDPAAKASSSMVYSNGTGIYFDPDTKMEVRRFEQEPFSQNRTDMDTEPSMSQTQTFLQRGLVGLCTPKMVAGSSMVYQTPLGEVNIRGRKVVIEANEGFTRVAMIEGESTIRSGSTAGFDLGGNILRAGQQAIIRPGAAGQAPVVQISDLAPAELSALDEKVSGACTARRAVYFEATPVAESGAGETPAEEKAAEEKASEETVAEAAAAPGAGQGEPIDLMAGFTEVATRASAPVIRQEIVPVLVVPVNLPVQFTVSPARLPAN